MSHGSDVPESASVHLRNALQILRQPNDQLGALEFDAIRVRLARALALVEPSVAPEPEQEETV